MRIFIVVAFVMLTTSIQLQANDQIAGVVVDANGDPIAGALVKIYTARPRIGVGVL